METALSHPATSSAYDMKGALGRAISQRMRDPETMRHLLDQPDLAEACERIAGGMAARFAAMSASGVDAVRRIAEETSHLASLNDEAVHRRFSGIPPARVDPLPLAEAERRQWIRETLIGENACVRAGAISPALAVAASQRIAIEVKPPAVGTDRVVLESAAYHPDLSPWRRIAEQAVVLAEQSDHALRMRFAKHPRMAQTEIPAEPQARTSWTRRALAADHVRRIAGIAQGGQTDAGAPAMMIELLGIRILVASREGIEFAGSLFVDGRRICDLSSSGEGRIETSHWMNGCSEDDLTAISDYIAAVGDARDGGRPDSLTDRILDQVSMHQAVEGYRLASAGALLFIEDGRATPLSLLSVAIPTEGTRAEAASQVRETHPSAVLLDDLDEEDAALVWMATC